MALDDPWGSLTETIYHKLGLEPMCWDSNPCAGTQTHVLGLKPSCVGLEPLWLTQTQPKSMVQASNRKDLCRSKVLCRLSFQKPALFHQEGRKGSEEGVPENLSVPLEGDRDFGELCGSHHGCQVPFRPPIPNVGLLLRRCSGKGLLSTVSTRII